MDIKILPLLAAMMVSLCGCDSQTVKDKGARPVKLGEVTKLGSIEKSYSGVVSSDQFSNLAFKMSGPIIKMNVLEGQRVRKGQVVAELDPTDFQLELEAKKASYLNCKSQLERAQKLRSKDAISTQEYETAQTNYTNAKSAFEYAQNTLNDTKLRAPFDGFIQKKFVENYQRVQSGQSIVCLINPQKLQIQFTIPETNITYFSHPTRIFIEFDSYKGQLFKAKVKEYVEASPDGSGVPVFLYIDDPDFDLSKYKISVGFSCRVIVHVDNSQYNDGMTVPLSAVVLNNDTGAKTVFIYNSTTGKVEQRNIQDSGTILGRDNLVVTGQIKPGDQVVVAGASYLVNGQAVKVLTK